MSEIWVTNTIQYNDIFCMFKVAMESPDEWWVEIEENDKRFELNGGWRLRRMTRDLSLNVILHVWIAIILVSNFGIWPDMELVHGVKVMARSHRRLLKQLSRLMRTKETVALMLR